MNAQPPPFYLCAPHQTQKEEVHLNVSIDVYHDQPNTEDAQPDLTIHLPVLNPGNTEHEVLESRYERLIELEFPLAGLIVATIDEE